MATNPVVSSASHTIDIHAHVLIPAIESLVARRSGFAEAKALDA
jgi:hypothetical protein